MLRTENRGGNSMGKFAGKFFHVLTALFILSLLVLRAEWEPPSTTAGKRADENVYAPLPPLVNEVDSAG
jgi:hypothetical protein